MSEFQITRVINEHPIVISKLKLKGHIDTILFAKHDSKDVCIIIDFKSIGSYPYKKKFGRKKDPTPSYHQEMQLAIYAVAVEHDFNISDSQMFLVYYNKDTSMFKTIEVDRKYMNEAVEYWIKVNKACKEGLPKLLFGYSPKQKWECGYCSFADKCKQDHIKEWEREIYE
jgi:CRISPR/Cas system-associated exonuclease Cas4 (RecB family)